LDAAALCRAAIAWAQSYKHQILENSQQQIYVPMEDPEIRAIQKLVAESQLFDGLITADPMQCQKSFNAVAEALIFSGRPKPAS